MGSSSSGVVSNDININANLVWQAGRLADAKQWLSAEALYRRILSSDPNNVPAHFGLAVSLLEQLRRAEAVAQAELLVSLTPDSAAAHDLLARAHHSLEHIDRALDAAEEAIRLSPNDPRYWGGAAVLCYHVERYAESLEFATKGLAIDPTDLQCFAMRVMSLAKVGYPLEALNGVKELLRRFPDDAYALLTARVATYSVRQLDEAKRLLLRAVARDPLCAVAHEALGTVAMDLGQLGAAVKHLREAVRLNPDLAHARRKLGLLQRPKRDIGHGFVPPKWPQSGSARATS